MMSNIKQLTISYVLIFTFTYVLFGQSAPNKVSLILKKCKADESTCHTQEIVKYNFVKGEYISKENLLSIDSDKGRFDFGSTLHNKQYVISDSGTFFDIKNKKLLGNNRGWVKNIIGDDVIVEINNVNYESGIFNFNLKKNKYEKIPSPNVFELDGGKLSPNNKILADWNGLLRESAFTFYKVSKDFKYKRLTDIKGHYSANCSIRCSSSTRVPFVWFDDSNIITQRENGKIISINIDGSIEDIVDLNIKETPDSLPYFSKDEFGNIEYSINGDTYSILVDRKSFETNKIYFGDNFYRIDESLLWKSYFYKNKSIGKFRASGGTTANGYLAAYYLVKNQNQGYYDGSQYWIEGGILIWNDIKKDWIRIEVDWGVQIIGWLEE